MNFHGMIWHLSKVMYPLSSAMSAKRFFTSPKKYFGRAIEPSFVDGKLGGFTFFTVGFLVGGDLPEKAAWITTAIINIIPIFMLVMLQSILEWN